jgi:predicted nuclease of predicted toxin-antitoxin system
MKFLIDAQLPVRLVQLLQASGHDAIHTKTLPQKNATPDSQINQISMQQERVVITKDSDFLNSFLTIQQPYKLLLVTTGNIKNVELEALFASNLKALIEMFEQHRYIEMSRDLIIIHQ